MAERSPSVEVRCLTAEADGVAPAILLSVRRGKAHSTPVQYLVNAPEGLARLALEHRCRAGPGLRALLLTGLSQGAAGGLAGLLLRLRQDGHAALRVLGPAGIHDTVTGLSAFVRWTHPELTLTALTAAQQGVSYEDECIEVRPLWTSSLLWQVPDWLSPAASSEAAEVNGVKGGVKERSGTKPAGQPRRKRARDDAGAGATEAPEPTGGARGAPAPTMPDASHRRGSKAAAGAGRGAKAAPKRNGKAAASGADGAAGVPLDPLEELRRCILRTSEAAAALLASKPTPAVAAAAAAAATAAAALGADATSDSASGSAAVEGSSAESWDSQSCSTASEGGGGGDAAGAADVSSSEADSDTVARDADDVDVVGGGGDSSSESGGGAPPPSRPARKLGGGAAKVSSVPETGGSGEAGSSSSSEESSSSDDSSSSSDTDAAAHTGAAAAAPPRKAEAAAAVATAAAKPRTQADLFSDLDRLFMDAASRGGPLGVGLAAARPGLAAGASGRGRGRGRGAAMAAAGGRGGRGTGRKGAPVTAGAEGTKGATATAAAAKPAGGADAALRSQVLQKLGASKDLLGPAGPVPGPSSTAPDGKRRRTAAQPTSQLAPVSGVRGGGGTRAQAQNQQPSLPGSRPSAEAPLGYLLFLKPVRQALLIVADGAAAEQLAAHPVTALLAAAPPELLLAAAHLSMAPAAAGPAARRYWRWSRGLPGSNLWLGGRWPGGGGVGPPRQAAPAAFVTATAVSAVPQGGSGSAPPIEAGEGKAAEAGDRALAVSVPATSSALAAPPTHLGHLSSCRLTMRLHAVAPALFPLPYELRRKVGDAGGGDGRGGARQGGKEPHVTLPTAEAADTEAAAAEAPGAGAEAGSKLAEPGPEAAAAAGAGTHAEAHVSAAEAAEGMPAADAKPGPTAEAMEAEPAGPAEPQAPRPSDDGGGGGGGSGGGGGGANTACSGLPRDLLPSLMLVLTTTAAANPTTTADPLASASHATTAATPAVVMCVREAGSSGSGAGAGGDAGAGAASAAAEGPLPAPMALRARLLEERRGSGLELMMQALALACPQLVRRTDAERLLRPPRWQGATSAAGGGVPSGHSAAQELMVPDQPPPGPHGAAYGSQAYGNGASGWSGPAAPLGAPPPAGGGWGVAAPPQYATQNQSGWPGYAVDPAAAAAAELAAAAAPYGPADRVGRVMLPTYSVARQPPYSSYQPPPYNAYAAGPPPYSQPPPSYQPQNGWAHAAPAPQPPPYPSHQPYPPPHPQQSWPQHPYPGQPQPDPSQAPAPHASWAGPDGQSHPALPAGAPAPPPAPSSAAGPSSLDPAANRSVAARLRAVMRGGGLAAAAANTDAAGEVAAGAVAPDKGGSSGPAVPPGAAAVATGSPSDTGPREDPEVVDPVDGVDEPEGYSEDDGPQCGSRTVASAGGGEGGAEAGAAGALDNRAAAQELRRRLRAAGQEAALTAPNPDGHKVATQAQRKEPEAGSQELRERALHGDQSVSGAPTEATDSALGPTAAAALRTYRSHFSRFAATADAPADPTAPQKTDPIDDVPTPPCLLPPPAPHPSLHPSPATAAATAAADGVALLFLGTGSAEPSKYRGSSAVLLTGLRPPPTAPPTSATSAPAHPPGASQDSAANQAPPAQAPSMAKQQPAPTCSILIDAGEGAYGALVRWLGPKGAAAQARALAIVWLSHKHPDHVLGLPALLEVRAAAEARSAGSGGSGSAAHLGPPLLVVGPAEVGRWLASVGPLHPTWRFDFLHCADFVGALQPPQPAAPASGSGQEGAPPGPGRGPGPSWPGASAAPGQAPCPCCPPPLGLALGPGGAPSAASAEDAWGLDAAAGGAGAGGAAGPGGARPGPSAAARLRWHQQQRGAAAAAAASATAPAGAAPPSQQPQAQHWTQPAAPNAQPWPPQHQPQGQASAQWQQPAPPAPHHAGYGPPPPYPPPQHPYAPPQQGYAYPSHPPPPRHAPYAPGPYGPPAGPYQPQDPAAAGRAVAAAAAARCGLVGWRSVGVHHCRDAWGLVLEHGDGWKLVYSGDTRPCPALVAAGRGATLLVHEATFEPCLEHQARGKRHSTSAEAAAVAEAMGAYRTVLTHFSQRYPRVPAGIDPWALPLRRRPLPAFDGLLLPLTALPAAPLALPPLALALAEPGPEEGEQGGGAEEGGGEELGGEEAKQGAE